MLQRSDTGSYFRVDNNKRCQRVRAGREVGGHGCSDLQVHRCLKYRHGEHDCHERLVERGVFSEDALGKVQQVVSSGGPLEVVACRSGTYIVILDATDE